MAEVFTPAEWAKSLRTPLERAAFLGNRDIAQTLIGAGADIGNTPHEAAAGGQGDMINYLLEGGVSIETEDEAGRSPLHIAARAGQVEMVWICSCSRGL